MKPSQVLAPEHFSRGRMVTRKSHRAPRHGSGLVDVPLVRPVLLRRLADEELPDDVQPLLRAVLLRMWNRTKEHHPVAGVAMDYAREVRRHVGVPVLCCGGFRDGEFCNRCLFSFLHSPVACCDIRRFDGEAASLQDQNP